MDRINALHIKIDDVLDQVVGEGTHAYMICPYCKGRVSLNGPGSTKTFLGRFSKMLAWLITTEAQELGMRASRLHDFQGHIGLRNSEENMLSAKQYRDHFYEDIEEKYKPKVQYWEIKKSELGSGFFNWFTRIKCIRQISYLKRRWKELELTAEMHYTILIEMGESNMIKERDCCAHKERYGNTRP